MKNEEKTITEAIETIAIQTIANLTAGDLALIIEEAAREIRQENTGL
jgi:hypothetical protein